MSANLYLYGNTPRQRNCHHPIQGRCRFIVGFGLNGRNVARAAKTAGIAYVIIESEVPLLHQAGWSRTRDESMDKLANLSYIFAGEEDV